MYIFNDCIKAFLQNYIMIFLTKICIADTGMHEYTFFFIVMPDGNRYIFKFIVIYLLNEKNTLKFKLEIKHVFKRKCQEKFLVAVYNFHIYV